mmetsp:Transcript_22559/g.58901  ORF Transcript_22559/g.58901 Transcript_22559/m.58901 type:complete len:203 (-) Transcript_22559:376-984(-)
MLRPAWRHGNGDVSAALDFQQRPPRTVGPERDCYPTDNVQPASKSVTEWGVYPFLQRHSCSVSAQLDRQGLRRNECHTVAGASACWTVHQCLRAVRPAGQFCCNDKVYGAGGMDDQALSHRRTGRDLRQYLGDRAQLEPVGSDSPIGQSRPGVQIHLSKWLRIGQHCSCRQCHGTLPGSFPLQLYHDVEHVGRRPFHLAVED